MLKRVAVVFFVVFISVMPALAMTADEFLSHKAENREAAMRVLGAAEEGGVPKLLLQAKMLPSVAQKLADPARISSANRAAFLHCAFASHLIKNMSAKEQAQYGNDLINTLSQLATSLGMSEEEMFKTLQGASGIFNGILNGEESGAQEQVPVAQNAPAKANTGGGILEKLKASYLPGFPANEGYQTVEDAFNSYFGDPRWALHDQLLTNVRLDGHTLVFKGIGYLDERKAVFEVFMFWAYQEKGKKQLAYIGQNVSINGVYLSPLEEKDFMSTIMVDSKQ